MGILLLVDDDASQTVDLSGLASREAHGTPQINLSFAPAGLPSREAHGALAVGDILVLPGLPSREAHGPVRIDMQLLPPGLPSREAYGTVVVPTFTLKGQGLPSREAHGIITFSVDQAINLLGLQSREEPGRIRFALDGGHIAGGKDQKSGPTSGGESITLLAVGLDMEAANDSFSDGVLSSTLWSPTLVGSGGYVEVPGFPMGSLQLFSGRTAGSSVTIRGADTPTKNDLGLDVEVSSLGFRNGITESSSWVGLHGGTSTSFRASIVYSEGAKMCGLHIRSTENGDVRDDFTLPLVPSRSFSLRVLRSEERVYVFLNGALMVQCTWTNVPAAVEFGAANDPTTSGSSILATVKRMSRNPVILFGSEPMRDVLGRSRGRLDGLTPPHADPGTVPVNVTTYYSSFDMDDEYTYVESVDYRLVGLDGTMSLVATGDSEVRN